MRSYVIAEIGINHNGSFEIANKLIEVAAKAGCSAAKFQIFSAKRLYPESAGYLDWQGKTSKYSYDIYQAVKGFETPLGWVDPLRRHCESLGIDFLASVFDSDGLNYLVEHGITKIKLSSYTITNIPLINDCAITKLPIIMSTGGATLGETEEAVNTILKYHNQLKLLHCSIQYPTALTDCHLGVIKTLQHCFPGLDIGYSDHTLEISDAATQAIYLGGKIIEKHITLDKNMAGPDHFFALEPIELQKMITDIRVAENNFLTEKFTIDTAVYGSTAKICHENEKYLKNFAYMSLFLKRKICESEQITPDDIIILRPGKKRQGLPPKYLHFFRKYKLYATKDLTEESPLTWDSILPNER